MLAAIIGVGVIGKVHFDVLQKNGETIVALCDIDPEKTAFFPGKKYSDWKKMLDEEEIDVVHICTPHYLHAEMTVYALGKNINVLCEKPLCIGIDEAERVLLAEKNSSAKLGVCFQNRYNPSSLFIKNYARSHEILSAEGEVKWRRDEAYYRSGDWRGKWKTEGGGVLINQAIHTLDLLQWVVGVPTAVRARCENSHLAGIIEVEDTVTADFFGERNFSLFATTAAGYDHPVKMVFRTAEGVVLVTPDSVVVNGERVELSEDDGYLGKRVYGNGHEKLISHFYHCVESGEKFPIDGEEGAQTVRSVLAAYRSQGQRIKI